MTAYAFNPTRERAEWRVFKYPLVIADRQSIQLPEMAEILSVQFQGDDLVLWAAVNPALPRMRQEIVIAGTGHPIDLRGLQFIATAQDPASGLVWHVFSGKCLALAAAAE